ncbi:MAG: ArnT family glycosyltransferase [Chloroflexota bacterium]
MLLLNSCMLQTIYRAARRGQSFIRDHPTASALTAVCAIAGIARIFMMLGAPVFIMKDSESYFLPGWDLAHGRTMDLELRRTPAYPWFIAVALRVFGDELSSVALLQHLLGVGTALATFWAARIAFGHGVALCAAVLVAISGPLLIFEHYVMPEALFACLLMLGAGCLLQGHASQRLGWFALGGALMALAALTRPAAQLVLIGLPLVMLLARVPWKATAIRSLVAAGACALITAPWMLEVYHEYGIVSSGATIGEPLIFRTVHQDHGFLLPDSTDSPYLDPIKNEARETVIEMAAKRENPSAMIHQIRRDYKLSRPDADAILRDVAIEIIRIDPAYYLESTARLTAQVLLGRHEALNLAWTSRRDRAGDDVLENWQSVPRIRELVQPATDDQREAHEAIDRLVNVFQPGIMNPLLLMLAAGGILIRGVGRESRAALLLAFIPGALILTATLFSGGVYRFRYPADPFLYILAAAGGAWCLQATGRLYARLQRFQRPVTA